MSEGKEYNNRWTRPLREPYASEVRAPRPGTSKHNAEYPRLDVAER